MLLQDDDEFHGWKIGQGRFHSKIIFSFSYMFYIHCYFLFSSLCFKDYFYCFLLHDCDHTCIGGFCAGK